MTTTSVPENVTARINAPGEQKALRAPIIVRRTKGWHLFQMSELVEYRELFYFLTWRNLKVRYKQTLLGVLWALLQPIGTMLIFTVFFGRLANMPSDGVPYPLFALTGLLPWIFFSNAVSLTTGSIVAEANLIKKVYFPRIIIPTSSVCSGLVDFAVGFVMLLVMMPFFDFTPSIQIFLVPLLLVWLLMTSFGIGTWLATLNGLYRDVHHIVPFALQLGLFLTPIVYPSSLLSERWRMIYGMNPMVGVVESFRWMMLGYQGEAEFLIAPIMLSLGVSLILFITGFVFFRKMEPTFADVV